MRQKQSEFPNMGKVTAEETLRQKTKINPKEHESKNHSPGFNNES